MTRCAACVCVLGSQCPLSYGLCDQSAQASSVLEPGPASMTRMLRCPAQKWLQACSLVGSMHGRHITFTVHVHALCGSALDQQTKASSRRQLSGEAAHRCSQQAHPGSLSGHTSRAAGGRPSPWCCAHVLCRGEGGVGAFREVWVPAVLLLPASARPRAEAAPDNSATNQTGLQNKAGHPTHASTSQASGGSARTNTKARPRRVLPHRHARWGHGQQNALLQTLGTAAPQAG